mmetsp:Transcript_3438/g.9768  ORF Transcript_3438/g.9768 Transcript_3438/m.9768 type:complete len:97 (-) Transcript_3438:33-323(-)
MRRRQRVSRPWFGVQRLWGTARWNDSDDMLMLPAVRALSMKIPFFRLVLLCTRNGKASNKNVQSYHASACHRRPKEETTSYANLDNNHAKKTRPVN